MGRRDHLLRIALSANQSQLVDPPSDDDEEDLLQTDPTSETSVKLDSATAAKLKHQTKLDAAQEAILSAIGFMTDSGVKKTEEEREKEAAGISTFVGLITYHLPLPMYSQRNQALVSCLTPAAHSYPRPFCFFAFLLFCD